MALGKLVHYTADAVLLSTVLAGVRRSSGFSLVIQLQLHPLSLTSRLHRPNASAISDPTVRSVAEKFLGVGETIFDMVQASAVNSSYFKKTS
jgi:hypothetical protein